MSPETHTEYFLSTVTGFVIIGMHNNYNNLRYSSWLSRTRGDPHIRFFEGVEPRGSVPSLVVVIVATFKFYYMLESFKFLLYYFIQLYKVFYKYKNSQVISRKHRLFTKKGGATDPQRLHVEQINICIEN